MTPEEQKRLAELEVKSKAFDDLLSKNEAQEKRLLEIEGKSNLMEIDALVAPHVRAGKVLPAQKEHFKAVLSKLPKSEWEGFSKNILENLPVQVKADEEKVEGKVGEQKNDEKKSKSVLVQGDYHYMLPPEVKSLMLGKDGLPDPAKRKAQFNAKTVIGGKGASA